MPKYKITDPQTGKVVTVSGTRPPTQEDANKIFADAGLRSGKDKSFVEKFAQTVMPGVERFGRQVGAGLGLRGADQAGLEQSLSQASDINRRLAERLKIETDPRQRELIAKTLRESTANISNIAQGSTESAQEVSGLTGDRSNIEESVRTGLGLATELGSLLVPQGKAASSLGRVGQAGLQGLGVGALQGTSQATREAESLLQAGEEVGKGALAGALTAGAIQGAGELVSKTSKGFSKAADSLRKRGYESYARTFKENKTAQRIVDASGGPEKLAKEMIDNKVPKTKSGVRKQLRKMSSQYEKEVTQQLKKIGQTRNVNVDASIDELISSADKVYNLPDPRTQREKQAFIEYLESFRGQYAGPKGNLNNINNLRKELDLTYRGVDPSRVVDGEKLANDMLSNKLRGLVQKKAPITKKFFKKYSLLKKAEEIFYKEPKTGIVEATIAAAAPGTGAVNILEFLGGKAFRSPGVSRGLSSLLSRREVPAGIPIPEPAISKVGAGKTSKLINPSVAALQRFINRENEERVSRKNLP